MIGCTAKTVNVGELKKQAVDSAKQHLTSSIITWILLRSILDVAENDIRIEADIEAECSSSSEKLAQESLTCLQIA